MNLGPVSKFFLESSRKSRILSAAALFLVVCAFGAAGVAPLAPDVANMPVRSISQELALPQLADQIAMLEKHEQQYFSEEKVRPGDTLATLMNRLGVNDPAAANFIKTDRTAKSMMRLMAGKKIQVRMNDAGELQWLSTNVADGHDSPARRIVITRAGDTFKALDDTAELEKRVEMHGGEIKSSLFAATDAALIPDAVAKQIIDMFATDIDFGSDLRRGDRFNVVYETFWQNGEFVQPGRILAAEFVNAGKTFQTVWFDEGGSKQGGYYSFDGRSLKKAFLKSPLEFSRISSGFSMRVHPISGQWKQHKGVDFAAPAGTAIRASADGVIKFAGVSGGYGNMVVVKHWAKYSTAYAHMSRFAKGIRNGAKVAQGDVIGYVGSTGWATGPHLHYEFRVNDEARDPLSVVVPNEQPLAAGQLQAFHAIADEMAHRFALMSLNATPLQVASK